MDFIQQGRNMIWIIFLEAFSGSREENVLTGVKAEREISYEAIIERNQECSLEFCPEHLMNGGAFTKFRNINIGWGSNPKTLF